MPKIKIHEKALGHLSRGLYRSPASALRELVSNAWDANATQISINTNYPNFQLLTVEDNGIGFSKEQFNELMEGGIGNSPKRPNDLELINDRPLIGRLGIGMLGIAQICGSFYVLSKPEEGEPFKAIVHLYDLLKDKLDKDIVKGEIDIGKYDFENYDFENIGTGTLIYSEDIHPAFVRSFQRSLENEKFVNPPLGDWEEIIKIFRSVHSVNELGDYWKLIWELAVACPIPYLDAKALPDGLIKERQSTLESYEFKTILDGINLKKPVYLSENPWGYTKRKVEFDKKVYGKRLKFSGYLIIQEASQLKPDELRGILIRINNIGIGYYDPSLLDYRINEGPRSRWLTGEIFVEEGLENAMNVDRDSFNQYHPEFRALQEHIHTIFQNELFKEAYTKIKLRSEDKEKIREKGRNEHLEIILSDVLEKDVEVKTEKTRPEISKDKPEVRIKEQESKVEINLPERSSINTKKAYKQLATSILAIFEIAIQEEDTTKQKEIFTELIEKLLKGW